MSFVDEKISDRFIKARHAVRANPHYILIIMVILMMVIIFSERITEYITSDGEEDVGKFYNTSKNPVFILGCILVIIIALVIISVTVGHIAFPSHDGLMKWDSSINSVGSKNIISIFILMFFIVYVYEIKMYGNNEPNKMLNLVTFGHNKYISNRLVGVIILLWVTIVTSYNTFMTTAQ